MAAMKSAGPKTALKTTPAIAPVESFDPCDGLFASVIVGVGDLLVLELEAVDDDNESGSKVNVEYDGCFELSEENVSFSFLSVMFFNGFAPVPQHTLKSPELHESDDAGELKRLDEFTEF
ncbi:MAG: hypothetical protein M1820_005872 [Bogoriella megaspora]|nr:MAG: hypothetical protein M1820_005872 [Bogoriella megaspora]